MGHDSCLPAKYMNWLDNECYQNCPVFCSENEVLCSGGTDPHTGTLTYSHTFGLDK